MFVQSPFIIPSKGSASAEKNFYSDSFTTSATRRMTFPKKLKSSSSSKVDDDGLKVIGDADHEKDDLFLAMRMFLIFGKVIGVVPIGGIFETRIDHLSFRRWSFSGIISLVIIGTLSFNVGVALIGYFRSGGNNATEIAKNAAGLVCYSIGLFVYVFIRVTSSQFILFLKYWRNFKISFSKKDLSLGLCINLIAGLILTSAISENIVSHLLLFPAITKELNMNGTKDNLELYYKKSHGPWNGLIPYNPAIAIVVFLCNKWAVYAWNFGDLFVAICCRAMSGKFKLFLEAFQEKLEEVPLESSLRELAWSQAISDHVKLSKLNEKIAQILSPLIFVSYIVNIYFICIQLHLFLTPAQHADFLKSLYSVWSFLHLLIRTFVLTFTAARVNSHAHGFVTLIRSCPSSLYTLDMERMERKLVSSFIGMAGLNTFFVRTTFFLSVISVIFTFEIVLLQANVSAVMVPPD